MGQGELLLFFLLHVVCCWSSSHSISTLRTSKGCHFHPTGESMRFVRVPEDLRIGEEVLQVEVHPPGGELQLRGEDATYLTLSQTNRTHVRLLLARSLETLVDDETPQSVLKLRLSCEFADGEDTIASSLAVTVYVEDVNDHAPQFAGAPYEVSVDELTPVGLTVFRRIHATDRDKPNTPNSDVQYAITAGDERATFALDSGHQPLLVLRRGLDYEGGDREFLLTLTASDRGSPPRVTSTTLRVRVVDNDDQAPKFTRGVYRTRMAEDFPLTGVKLHRRLDFEPALCAYDQDVAIASAVRYDIIAGNERHVFALDALTGALYQQREIDLEAEPALPGNTFVLQVQATQVDNALRFGVARVEIEVTDVNDNLPEFEADAYNISIVENLPNGFSVLQIIAHDADQGDNAEFSYRLEDSSRAFNVDARTGWLAVRNQTVLDREVRTALRMRVYAVERTASVAAARESASYVGVHVTLLDANDNNPIFMPHHVYDFVADGAARQTSIGRVRALDPDLGANGMVHYFIRKTATTANASYPFRVDMRTGVLSFAGDVDVVDGRHLLFIEAVDQPANPSERRTALAVVTVDVLTSNNSRAPPTFVGAPYEFWVGADVDIGTSVGQIRVRNTDGNLLYDLLHSYREGVEERSGTITVIDAPRKFERVLYDFESVVSERKDRRIVTNVTIHVVDAKKDATAHREQQVEFHVRENQNANTIIGHINGTAHRGFKFFIANEQDVIDRIAIHPNGTLFTRQPLDREQRDIYRLTIIGESQRGAAAVHQVVVLVDDENDNAPRFQRSVYEGHVAENASQGAEVSLDARIRATDADSGVNGKFVLMLHGDAADKFRLDRFSGRVYLNALRGELDREKRARYQLKVVARDTGGLRNESTLLISIDDVNDNAPVFQQFIVPPGRGGIHVQEYAADGNQLAHLLETTLGVYTLPKRGKTSPIVRVPEDLAVGNVVLQLVATDADDGDVVSYEMMRSEYFAVQADTGEIRVARALPAERELMLNVSVTDLGALRDRIQVRILVEDVNDHAPVFRQTSYSFQTEEALFSRDILGRVAASDDDFRQNANISYRIETGVNGQRLPFEISEFSGVLSAAGELDRETRASYNFVVIAQDHPVNGAAALSASVNVEVHITDVNDNAPMFIGYDEEITLPSASASLANHQVTNIRRSLPVYHAAIAENAPIGTLVAQLHAIDADFIGNGNGLVIFDVPLRRNRDRLFAVDSKDGRITTMGLLDYERHRHHNVTVVASDLGAPSLSATALLMVTVVDVVAEDGDAPSAFAHRYYEVDVPENSPVPLQLLVLNASEAFAGGRFTIVQGDPMFQVDAHNGSLYLITSPDRERGAHYQLHVRLERIADLVIDEVRVLVRITDVNDNAPVFEQTAIVAAVPASAHFGYHVLQLHAADADVGLNGDVRYHMVIPDPDAKFAVDAVSGQVRVVASLTRDAGKAIGFDVKATDRHGAVDGISTIANVLVYVLADEQQLVMVVGARLTDVERAIDNITEALRNATGLNVRVRKLEVHVENTQHVDTPATDVHLYAVDDTFNSIVDMRELQDAILRSHAAVERHLEGRKVIALASGVRIRNQRVLLSTLEAGVVVLGCVVFIGALATAVCVACARHLQPCDPDPPVMHSSATDSGIGGTTCQCASSSTASSYEDSLQTGGTARTYQQRTVQYLSKRRGVQ